MSGSKDFQAEVCRWVVVSSRKCRVGDREDGVGVLKKGA